MRTVKTLIRLGGCPGWSESSLGFVGWLCWGLTSQSTIFQSYRDGATASWVINQYFRGVKCLAQGHNTAAVGFEPPTSRSGVRHSTTEPPRSPLRWANNHIVSFVMRRLIYWARYKVLQLASWETFLWPGPVARSDACPTGIQEVAGSILINFPWISFISQNREIKNTRKWNVLQ